MLSKLNKKLIVIVFLCSLSIMVAAVIWHQKIVVDDPLTKSLSNHPEVLRVELEHKDNVMLIDTELERTENIVQVYKDLSKIVSQNNSKVKFEINIKENSNKSLEDIYYKSHFILYEGANNSLFSKMKSDLDSMISISDVDNYIIVVDNENIYFQLNKGEYFLFRKISRSNNLGSAKV